MFSHRLALLFVFLRVAIPEAVADQHSVTHPTFQMHLRNGLAITVAEDHSLPVVSVTVLYHSGSADDAPSRPGLAHLLEHLTLRVTSHLADGEHKRILESLGGVGDGRTDADYGLFYFLVPAFALETALWIASDRVGFACDAITPSVFEAERRVVANERRQRIDNQASSRAFEKLIQLIYPSEHPYGHLTFGDLDSLQEVSISDAVAYCRSHMRPGNALLTVVGDVSSEEVARLVRKYFATLPDSGDSRNARGEPRPAVGVLPRQAQATVRAKSSSLTFGWTVASEREDDAATLELLALALSGPDGLLGASLRRDGHAKVAAECVFMPRALASLLVCEVVTPSPKSVKDMDSSIQSFAASLGRLPLPQATVDAAYTRWRSGRLRKVETVTDRAQLMAWYEHAYGDAGFLPTDIERHRAVSPEDIRSAARKWLVPERFASVRSMPEAE